jgi:hypothetical protein
MKRQPDAPELLSFDPGDEIGLPEAPQPTLAKIAGRDPSQ